MNKDLIKAKHIRFCMDGGHKGGLIASLTVFSGADVTPNNDATVDGVASGNSMVNRAR